ncbi:hypothetical protein ACP6H1_27290 [Vibrio harveyi]|uniref:hypothetical protein n=1 Tax=Vibrio harveyi TaxID=669 RepID=UPI003CF64806
MLKKKEQLLLFDKILRLSEAGLMQKHIAKQLSKYGTPKEKLVGVAGLKTIKEGQRFSIGLKPYVSANAYMSLLSSERVGEFQAGVQDAIASLQIDEASSSEIIKVLLKPIISITLLLIVCAGLAVFAFPALSDIAPRQTWSGFATSAESFCLFWYNHGITVGLMFIGFLALVVITLRRYMGAGRRTIDRLLVYRQYRFIQCTNLLTSIAHQTAVGMPLKEALEHYEAHTNPYLKHHIRSMLRIISKGKTNIGVIFDTGLLDDEELYNLILLSDTGETSAILKKSAQMHSQRLLLEIDFLKTLSSRVLKTALYSTGIWMLLSIGATAFSIVTNLKF